MFIGLDPLYFLIVGPGMLLAMFAQFWVKSAYARAQRIPSRAGLSGAETAQEILRAEGIYDVALEPVPGQLSDQYDPTAKVLRLSQDVYYGNSLASQGIAAHEVGHAIQDAQRYSALVLRNGLVPLASTGGNLSMICIFVGMLLMMSRSVINLNWTVWISLTS